MGIVIRIDTSTTVGSVSSDPESDGDRKLFDKDVVTIGRNNSNDLVLPQPQISGKHARLLLQTGKGSTKSLFLEDLGSSNGTYLGDTKLRVGVPAPVAPGQVIVIGGYMISAVIEDKGSGLRSSSSPSSRVEKPAALSKAEGRKTSASLAAGKEPKEKKRGARRAVSQLLEAEFRIKRLIHERLIEGLDLRRKDILSLSDQDLRNRAQTVIEQILIDMRWEIPEGLDRDRLIKQILDEALALGPLEELIADEECSEIMVNSFDMIYAERGGKLALTDLRFSSEQAVLAAIERILAPIGRRIDEGSPMVDARLKDGSRVNAVIRPLALNGPCITIRKFSRDPLTIADLVRFGSLSEGMSTFMKLAVENRLNIVISGGTGSGKTTLLNVVSSFVPEGQRVITVEDAAELQLPQEHLISFETRPPNLEGKGAVTIRDLVRNALRMRPDRIIVGECRGAEALDMLQAMNTGHDGSMTTGHANTPVDMVRRLETMVLTAGLDLPVRAVREQIASAVNLIVQQTRFSCGTRKVTAISEIIGMDYDEGTVLLQDVFTFRQEGFDEQGRTKGYHQATGYVPKFFQKLQQRGLAVDAKVFSPDR